MIRQQGIKLWADGLRWVGTAALSNPYLRSATVRGAGIPVGPAGESAMNYSRAQLDAALASTDWPERSAKALAVRTLSVWDDRDAERR